MNPVPKPTPRERAPRKPIARTARPKAVNRKRKAAELLRAYGPPERRAFVKSLPCCACGVVGYSDNAHIETDGMGRKADYTKIVPLCNPYSYGRIGYSSCHFALDVTLGRKRFEEYWTHCNLDNAAAWTEQAWQAHVHATVPPTTKEQQK